MISSAISVLIVVVATLLAFFTIIFGPDGTELLRIRCLDVFVGLLFGCAFVSARLRDFGPTTMRRELVTVFGTLAIWTLFSGTLLLWHEGVVRVRLGGSARLLTLNRIKMAQTALCDFENDCGRFPSQEQGLDALIKKPGIEAWSGPYTFQEHLLDAWGNLLKFRVIANKVEVWSVGRDGVSGTDDDVNSLDSSRE